MEPSTPQRHQVSRDQAVQILTLRSIGLSYEAIASNLSLTVRQVQNTCSKGHPTPKKRSGRPTIISKNQLEELIQYIRLSKFTRRLSYAALAIKFEAWNITEYQIRTALRKANFSRRIARSKPPISEINRQKRLAWAQEHLDWTEEQWNLVFWTDETWVTGGRHKRVFVTRQPGEELDPTCIVEKYPKRQGWMFWGGFAGSEKGPCLFWEKEWGTIGQRSYSERIIPLIHGWIRLRPSLILMQDGAPGHTGGDTKAELSERGIRSMAWPPYSPDLNPIETVWDIMKDWIEANYPEKLSYDQLRRAVKEAWDSIADECLKGLIMSMRDRCAAVIEANGMHTRY